MRIVAPQSKCTRRSNDCPVRLITQLSNSLRLQLVLLIGGLAMSSAVAYVLLTTHLVQRQIEADQFKLQRILVTRMASQLDQDMNARTVELRFIAGLDRLRDPTQSLERKQALLLAQKAAYPFYAWIGVADTQGRIIASTEPRINGADVSQRTWFLGGRQRLHHEDIHDAVLLGKLLPRSELDDQPLRLMDIALPLQDHDGRFIGVLGAHLSLDWTFQLRNHLLDQLDAPGLELILINRAGEVIVGSPSLPTRTGQLSTLRVVQRAQAGQISTAVETWPDGKRYLTAAAPALGSHPYPGLGWTALVRLDEDTAFASARRLGWMTLAAGLTATLGFAGVIWWVVGRKLRPMERLSQAVADLDVNRPLVVLPEVAGDGEVAVFARSMGRVVNALGESRERFQTLLDNAPVAMAFVEPGGRLLFLNARFTELLGYDARHLPDIEQWFMQAYPEGPSREAARTRWQQALPYIGQAANTLPSFEHELRCFDGSTRIVEASGIALRDGVLVSFQDMTARRQAEASLRLWAEAFEHSDVGFMIADVKTNTIISANPAFAQQRGYTSAELSGMPVKCLYPQNATHDLQAALDRVHQQDHVVFETEHIARDGHIFPVLIDVTLLRDGNGQPLRRIASVQDLTERERAAKEIHRLNAELEQRVVERTAELSAANRELDSFAYTVSHDLRAPLRTVNGFVHILLSEFADTLGDEGREYLQRVQDGTRRMSELIEGLLALSRHTNKPLERVAVNLSAIAERRLAELASIDPSRQVTVKIEPGLVADCDAALAEALMVNLLDNAWKYSAKTDNAQICFCQDEVDGLRGFCVRDNGAGFDMTKAGNLFEPFQRLHHTTEFQGTGVGLATVRRIVDRHGGRITVQAAPGQGARFCFTLRAEA
jgi:PAS domain S-box-containing protein